MFNKKNTIIFVSAITAWRAYLCASLQLHHDEAYYWLWTKHLALSYFDHPPMVSYFIKFTTLFSSSEFFVRFSGIIVTVVLSVLLWKLTKEIFNSEEAASGAVVLLNIMPVTMTGGVLITPDTPAFLFWGLSFYYTWKAFKQESTAGWYLSGLFFGLAMMSKYTTVLFGGCILLYMLVTEDRKWLKSPHPYFAAVLAMLVFSPVVLWNYDNSWISFKFQLGHGLGDKAYKFSNLLEYLGGQLLVASPFVWLAGMYACFVVLFSKEKGKIYLSLTTLFVILFFGWASLKKPGEANWPALAYFSFAAVTAGYFLGTSKFKKALFIFMALFSFALSFLATLHTRFSVLPLAKWNTAWAEADATNFFYGWKELARELETHPDAAVILTQSHQLSAEIAYYTRTNAEIQIDPKLTRFSQFNFWKLSDSVYGRDGLFVHYGDHDINNIKADFNELGMIKHLTVFRKGFPIRKYRIIEGKGFNPPWKNQVMGRL